MRKREFANTLEKITNPGLPCEEDIPYPIQPKGQGWELVGTAILHVPREHPYTGDTWMVWTWQRWMPIRDKKKGKT